MGSTQPVEPGWIATTCPVEKYAQGIALELLKQDSRIVAYSFYGDIQDDAGYIPSKEKLLFPLCMPSADHQIAHMVEMRNPSRWTIKDWGMVAFNGSREKGVNAAMFFAALAREIRVRSIQLHLDDRAIHKNSTLYNIFNNSYWWSTAKHYLPFGRFTTMAEVEAWANDLRDKTYMAWNVDRIRHEWSVRLEHIQHWMETAS